MDEKHQLKRKKLFELSEQNCEQIKRRRETSTERGVDCGEEEKEEVAEGMPIEDKAKGSFSFDVFISFRGEDTRNGFTSHLHKELKTRGIKTFSDSEDLERGEKISNILFKHMEESKIFVPVFSPNYADSKWCLRETAKMVGIKEREGGKRDIIPVFYEVEPAVVKHCTGSFGEAFEKHQRDKRLDDKQINEWRTALTKAAGLSGCPSDAQRNEANLITSIGQTVSERLCKVPYDIQPLGIDHCMHTLKEMLEREKDGVQVIGIWGLGGIGKTTLAMALYNKLFTTFERSCFLLNVRDKKSELHFLQAQFLNKVLGENMSIDNVKYGVSLMKRRLGSQKVILVLDGVDDIKQLEAFTANRRRNEKWFGAGSKIIVTTRDKEVLYQHGLEEDDIYFPKGLSGEHSLQLFCHHAFSSNQPPEEFKEISRKVVEVAKGLPLALEEFGKLFQNWKEKEEWEDMLENLKRDQNKEVYERLKMSYDSLDRYGKSVFLDIACFFIGKIRKYPFYMWEACRYSPITTLKALQRKSLITVNKDDIIEMHDQIRDMGRMKVKEEGEYDPLKYSRLWSEDQVLKVLTNAKPRSCVQIIDFTEVSDESETTKTSWNVIAAMPNLRMITGANRNHVYEVQEGIIRLPSNIRWFGWKPCPYQSLTFHGEPHKHILVLDLQYGELQDLRSHRMEFPNLKVLDLRNCENLSRTPDFTHLPSLEVLMLDWCTSLVEMDESIGRLEKLVKLSMKECKELKGLPAELCNLMSLESLDLSKCEQISVLPTRIGDLRSLKHLALGGTSMSALPDSIGSLQCLEDLYLDDCFSLEKLPDSIEGLKSLSLLSLCRCRKLEQLPNSMGMQTSLKELRINDCKSLREVPDSLGDLNNELQIALKGCISLEKLPNSIMMSDGYRLEFDGWESLRRLPDSLGDRRSSTVRFLSLNGCKSLEKLPESIGMRLERLEELDLSGCTLLTRIPQSIGNLKSLKRLILKRCQSLEELPAECISMLSLEELDLSGCTSVKSIPESIGDLKRLRHLSLEDCRSLKELPESIEGLESLKMLHIGGGMSVKKVPDFIRKLTNLQHLYLREIDDIPKHSIGMIKSLKELHLSGCSSLRTIAESIGELNCLEQLILIHRDGLSRDLMAKLSQASFKRLKRLLISGASEGPDLLFPLPKSKKGHVVKLEGRCSLSEKLPCNTSDINIRIQVVVQGKIVDELTCEATRDPEDDGAQVLENWGLGGQVFYKITIREGYKILRCVKKGNPTWISEREEEEEDYHPGGGDKILERVKEGNPTSISEREEEDYHPGAHKMLGLEEEEEEEETVRIGGWGMLRVPTNYSYGRLSMAFFEVTYSDKSTCSSHML